MVEPHHCQNPHSVGWGAEARSYPEIPDHRTGDGKGKKGLRARCAFDRSTPGVRIQRAAEERAGAVGSRHPGAHLGVDGSDGIAQSKQMFTTSV